MLVYETGVAIGTFALNKAKNVISYNDMTLKLYGRHGRGGEIFMYHYHYIEDKAFRKDLWATCSGVVNQLVQQINNGSVMKVQPHLVGSGVRNLIT